MAAPVHAEIIDKRNRVTSPWVKFFNALGSPSGYQPLLVSGTNIKTINGNSILGAGNISISGGGGSGNSYNPSGW